MLVAARLALLGNVFPTYAWDFRRGALPPGSTFTRASTARYFGANGLQQSAAIDTPRYEIDPATGARLGLLREVQSTNLTIRSEAFDNGIWTKKKSTLTADQAVAPDGNTTADLLTEDNTDGSHDMYVSATLATATAAGFSCFFKAGTRSKFFIAYGGAVANHYAMAVFDLATGTVSQTAVGSGSGTILSTQIRAVGNGWYRCGLIASITGANAYFEIGLASLATGNTIATSGEVSYLGTGTGTGYFWGAQQDSPGVGITSYVPTVASTVTRAQDILTLPLSSLPGWNGSRGGVLVASYRLLTLRGNSQTILALYESSALNNAMMMIENYGGAGSARQRGVSATVVLDLAGAASPTAFTRRRTAIAWSATRHAITHGGTLDGGNSGQALPSSLATLDIGGDGNGMAANAALESIAYYVGERADAFVQAVSRG